MKESDSEASKLKVIILTSTIVKEFRGTSQLFFENILMNSDLRYVSSNKIIDLCIGEISLSTSRSTKIYVNIDIPEANELINFFK